MVGGVVVGGGFKGPSQVLKHSSLMSNTPGRLIGQKETRGWQARMVTS